MILELLYVDGCPGHARLLPVLRELGHAHGATLVQRRVGSAADAERMRFLGSPSVRVDGVDVEPGARGRTDFGLTCRLYRSGDGQSCVPPRPWIERALRPTTH